MKIWKIAGEYSRVWNQLNDMYDLAVDNPWEESDEIAPPGTIKQEDPPVFMEEPLLSEKAFPELYPIKNVDWENINWKKSDKKISEDTGRSIQVVRRMRTIYQKQRPSQKEPEFKSPDGFNEWAIKNQEWIRKNYPNFTIKTRI
jgi:hypothetical protein